MLMGDELILEELPLAAKTGLDLTGDCVGDLANLRDDLLYNATLNQLTLNDQNGIRQRLYRKYLGCDLYYIFVDDRGNVTYDVLVRADNPSGNLLNCGTADVASIENNELELLSNIGLFFHPDKTGVLKINSNNYKWQIDYDKLSRGSVYVFPDPEKYGNIGKNKRLEYPLIIEHKMDSYIRNSSSGQAAHAPIGLAGDTYVNSYYTKQDNEYRLINNNDLKYSFNNLLNRGIIKNYSTDIFGNEFAILEEYDAITDDEGKTIIVVPDKVQAPSIEEYIIEPAKYIAINGGYILDPYNNNLDDLGGFNHDEKETIIEEEYKWTGKYIDGGTFCKCNKEDGSCECDKEDTSCECNIENTSCECNIEKPLIFINTGTEFDEDKLYDNNMHNAAETFIHNMVYEYNDHFEVIGHNKNLETELRTSQETIKSDIKIKKKSDLTATELDKLPEKHGILLYKNKSSFESPIAEYIDDEGTPIPVDDYFMFNDKIFIVRGDNSIDVYDVNSLGGEPLANINIEVDRDHYQYLYNESEETVYIAELFEHPVYNQESNKEEETVQLRITAYKLNDILNDKIIIDTRANPLTKTFRHRSDSEEFSMTFSYNNNLKRYLLCYMVGTFENVHLYTLDFKLDESDIFDKTLKINHYGEY